MKRFRVAPGSAQGVAPAIVSGFVLFAVVTGGERLFGVTGAAASLFEEAMKTALLASGMLILSGTAGWTRFEALGCGLQAVALFAAAESAAYALAFPDAETVLRLAWSLPLHLGCAMLEALGLAGLAGRRGRAKLPSCMMIVSAWAIHIILNAIASSSSRAVMLAAMIPLDTAFIALSALWLRSAARNALSDGRKVHGGSTDD
ncbi:MAG: hypothetical protein WAZ31_03590 [Rectinemataceae bacterium]